MTTLLQHVTPLMSSWVSIHQANTQTIANQSGA